MWLFFLLMKEQNFDDITLGDLEYDVIIEELADFALGETARSRIRHLRPSSDFQQIKIALQGVQEYFSILTERDHYPSLNFQELVQELRLLKVPSSVLEINGFLRIKRASLTVNEFLKFFESNALSFPILTRIVQQTEFTDEIVKMIDEIIGKNDKVKDESSVRLLEIRTEIKLLRIKINRNFERELKKYDQLGLLGDVKETFVNERRALSVNSTYKREVKGIILDSSKSGSLTYIEPYINVELNNNLELLLDDERKEIFRILKILTKKLREYFDWIKSYQNILTELDFIHAKSKLAINMKACLPAIVDFPHIELIDVFHPILRKNNDLLGKPTFPQNVLLDKTKRMLVISGPNAGGKSITLKTIGLNQLMLQSGMLVPMNNNSKMCLFQQVKTDIGDHQSIEDELSTYSFRLKRMKHFLKVSNHRTLLLLDEFGTGSDPDLGGALAEVFFEILYQTKCFGVITTHYGNIKLKADELKNAINGCMLYDTETLTPLYKFSMGQPGSSFTFEVAEINGIPKEIIEEAKKRISKGKLKMDKLLSDLQQQKSYLQRLISEHIEAQKIAEDKRIYFLGLTDEITQKEEKRVRAFEQDNKFVQLGKKLERFVENYKLGAKKKNANESLIKEMEKYLIIEKTKREEAHKAKTLKKKAVKPKKPATLTKEDEFLRDKIKVGSTVKMIGGKQNGVVEELNDKMVMVLFGIMKVKVEKQKLRWIKN